MGIISGRIDRYLDKYMSMQISEWNLSRCGDMGDIEKKLGVITKDIDEISSYSADAMKRMDMLDKRVNKLKTKR